MSTKDRRKSPKVRMKKLYVAGFDSPSYVLEMKERNFVCRANRLLLVKCYDSKKVKSPYKWVIYPLTQPQVANQQQQKKVWLAMMMLLRIKNFKNIF